MGSKTAKTAVAILLTLGMFQVASAQATRTWVSGVGDDVNPCSRTAPCKTFAGAISKTAAGGEISVLDPGGFGAVTITKAITIDGGGSLAGILSAGVNGVTVNANAATDTVILRNITINGAGISPGANGIRYLAGARLVVDNVSINGVPMAGIEVALGSGTGALVARNVNITGGTSGVKVTSGGASVALSNVSLRGAVTGVDALSGVVDIDRSVVSNNSGFGALAEGGTINLRDSMVSGNAVGVQAATGSTLRMSDTDVYSNLTGFGCGGGTLATAGNNRKAGNTGGAPSCATSGTVTVF